MSTGTTTTDSPTTEEEWTTTDRTLQTHDVGDFTLESGTVLRGVRQVYHLDGELNTARDNLVVVFHALTGSADAAGDWWSELIGPGRALDTRRYAVLCANLLGSCYGTEWRDQGASEPPTITPRDMARLVGRLVDHLGARSVALAVGGSLGGMVAQEWAATFPERTRNVIAFAAPAAHTAHAIALNHVQKAALQLGGSGEGAGEGAREAHADGLALARMIAMISYRTPDEFESRFGREQREDGRFQAQSYLDHHGQKLIDRFDALAYRTLTEAMDAHDVGHGRGGTSTALQAFQGRLIGVAIPGDALYPAAAVRRWTDAANAEYREIQSIHGHDAFLIETEQVAAILSQTLDPTSSEPHTVVERSTRTVVEEESAISTVSVPSPAPQHASPSLRPRVIRLALAGCGTVGGGLIQLLHERESELERRHGIRFEIVRVLVRDTGRDRGLDLSPKLLTDDVDTFLDAEADILVEAMGGLEPARTLAQASIERGRSVVTANKLLIATEGAELARDAARTGAHLAFEAAVGGGAPVVRTLRHAITPAGVRTIRGILNGTSNFILSEMDSGSQFDGVLEEAQRRGLAEADPTRDLDGRDVEDKIRILAWVAFGVDPAKLEVEREGLLPDPDARVAAAHAEGGVLRLVAESERTEKGVRTVVKPIIVSPDSALGRTTGEENLVEFETESSGTLRVSGPGAGGPPTASAVLSDLVEVAGSV